MRRVLLILLIITGLYSNELPEKRTNFGVKGGLNISNVYGDYPETNSKFGLAVGAFMEYKVNQHLSIQPELFYTQKGADYTVEGYYYDYSDLDYTISLEYFEFPILAKLNHTTQDQSRISLYGGPSIAFNLSGTLEMESNGTEIKSDIENMKSTEFGVILGGSIQVKKFIIDVRYNFGLSQINKQVDGEDESDAEVTNRVVSLMVGYQFD